MSDLSYTTGVFREFKATVRFHLGKIQTDVYKDSVIQFDGSTLKLDGGQHSLPELRSAIKAGWLVPTGTSVSDYLPKSANVKVRPAMESKVGSVSTEVQQEETIAGPARKTATTDGVRMESKAFNATLVRDTEGDGRTVGSSTKKAPPTGGDATEGETVAKIKTSAKKNFTLDGSTSMNTDVESGDVTGVVEHVKGITPKVSSTDDGSITREGQSSDAGKVIANVKVAAKRKVTLTDASSVDAEISKLDNASRVALAPKGKRDIAAMAGDTLEEIVPANEPENRGKALAEQAKAKRLAALKAKELEESRSEEAEVEAPPAPKPVKVKTPRTIEEAVVNGDEVELAPGVRWNKKLHWKTRVKQALQYRDRPEILDLIRGYEAESVVKLIDAALSSGSL
jgi:hypothetical protein